jgi:hypothetical protein
MKEIKKLWNKHKLFLDSIVDDLPEGYIWKSMRLEVRGIIDELKSVQFHKDLDLNGEIKYWERVYIELGDYNGYKL